MQGKAKAEALKNEMEHLNDELEEIDEERYEAAFTAQNNALEDEFEAQEEADRKKREAQENFSQFLDQYVLSDLEKLQIQKEQELEIYQNVADSKERIEAEFRRRQKELEERQSKELIQTWKSRISALTDIFSLIGETEAEERQQKAETDRAALEEKIESDLNVLDEKRQREEESLERELEAGRISQKEYQKRKQAIAKFDQRSRKEIRAYESKQTDAIETEVRKRSSFEKTAAIFRATLSVAELAINAYLALSKIPVVGPALGAAAAATATIFGVKKIDQMRKSKFALGGGVKASEEGTIALLGEAGQDEFVTPEITFEDKFEELADRLFKPFFALKNLAQENTVITSKVLADRASRGLQNSDRSLQKLQSSNAANQSIIINNFIIKQSADESSDEFKDRVESFLDEKIQETAGSIAKGIINIDQVISKLINE